MRGPTMCSCPPHQLGNPSLAANWNWEAAARCSIHFSFHLQQGAIPTLPDYHLSLDLQAGWGLGGTQLLYASVNPFPVGFFLDMAQCY